MIGVNIGERSDPAAKARGFKQKHGITYPILLDTEGKLRSALGVRAVPTNVILDRTGKVRYFGAGFRRSAIDQQLQSLMRR